MDKGIRIDIPAGASGILQRLEDSGHEAFVVGGCVRDSLLGRFPHDWDITTSASPAQVKALFPRTVDTGLKHGTVTVMDGRDGYEVTTYRIDGEYLDGRHPSEVSFTTDLREDLLRRDFTINAMAYSPARGLVDCFDGLSDLREGRIRAVGDPMQRFGEDALRIMRAVRFSAQLGYEIEEGTVRAMKILAPTLSRVSAERIAAELNKLLVSPHPDRIRMAYECGITAVILPEFDRCMETPQNNPNHRYTVGEHTIQAMMHAEPDRVLRTVMLLHDFGKPDCRTTDRNGIDHFYGHPDRSAEMAEEILRRLKTDNETRRKVVQLVQVHDREVRLTAPGVRKAVIAVGEDLFPMFLRVKEADILAQSMYRREEKLAKLAQAWDLYLQVCDEGSCLSLRDLAVNGDDLIAAGMAPGPEIGRVLGEMLADVVDEPAHNTRDYLMENHFPSGPAGR